MTRVVGESIRTRLISAGDLTLADIGEKALLTDFLLPMCREECGDYGLGNDAGVMAVTTGSDIVVTSDRAPSDLLAKRYGVMTPIEFGAYLVRVNLSDLAATGATPLGLLVTAAFNASTRVSYVVELMSGVYRTAANFSCPVIGGDTKSAIEESVSAAAFGLVPQGKAVGRGPIQPGMFVFLSGPVGHAGVALRWFRLDEQSRRRLAGIQKASELDEEFRVAVVAPEPRLDLTSSLLSSGCRCAMDITDGLGQTLLEISAAQAVAIEVDFGELRFRPNTVWAADALGLDLREVVGGIGLDLELLVIDESCPDRDRFYQMGRVLKGEPKVTFTGGEEFPVRGFQHFTADAEAYLR